MKLQKEVKSNPKTAIAQENFLEEYYPTLVANQRTNQIFNTVNPPTQVILKPF